MPPLHLLPASSTPFERALSEATDPTPYLAAPIDALRGIKLIAPPPSLLPYLVYEYGLGVLTPYIANLYDLIEEGIPWSRRRGTPAALDQALGWLGYMAALEEAPTDRRRWNLFELGLDRVRDSEDDLEPIEGVSELSTPLRSVLYRGFAGYDVRAFEWSASRWSGAIWSDHSGVRLRAGGAKWSFGRSIEIDHQMTMAELTALGVWIEPMGDGEPNWLDIPWPDFAWSALGGDDTRSQFMLLGVPAGTMWAVFRDAADQIIGYRRARIQSRVVQDDGGPYSSGGLRYAPAATGAAMILVEALTDFGDGDGHTARSVSFILAAEPADGAAPGRPWLAAGELAGMPVEVARTAVDIPFGRTVRDGVRALLRF